MLSKFVFSPFHLISSPLHIPNFRPNFLRRISPTRHLLLFHSHPHNEMTNVAPSPATNINFTNFSTVQTGPRKKREEGGGKNSQTSVCPSPSHGSQDDEMISGRVLVTALLPHYPTLRFRFG